MELLQLDLGCGGKKKPGTIGLDYAPAPGVDVVLNLERDRLPYGDRTVGYVHSSHFLEHLTSPLHLFTEISRVCADEARLEFWTPYVWHDNGFILDHSNFYHEELYWHWCVSFTDVWWPHFQAAWLLHEITYVVEPITLVRLYEQKIPIDFALRYCKGIVCEIGATITVRHNYTGDPIEPERRLALAREGDRFALPPLKGDFPAPAAWQAACEYHRLTPVQSLPPVELARPEAALPADPSKTFF